MFVNLVILRLARRKRWRMGLVVRSALRFMS